MAKLKKGTGVLLPVFSLPNRFGCGSFDETAYRFIDFLQAAGMRYWEVLPMWETDNYNCPYQGYSTRALNPFFINLLDLVKMELVTEPYLKRFELQTEKIDYDHVKKSYMEVLWRAFQNYGYGHEELKAEVTSFEKENADWLNDYALFRALVDHFAKDGIFSFTEWPEDIRNREPEAMDKYAAMLKERIRFYSFLQYLAYTQWRKLKKYANCNGILIIGDVPIYPSAYSVDVWANREEFNLYGDLSVALKAGVPPDYFNKKGQLWGNPTYNWANMKESGYTWWIDRVRGCIELFDATRIDHFRGLYDYWGVPAWSETAEGGDWYEGPRMDLLNAINAALGDVCFIAEDLGIITEKVEEFRDESGLPGMSVTPFGFDSGDPENIHYAKEYNVAKKVVFTGTHDTETIVEKLRKMFEDAMVEWNTDIETWSNNLWKFDGNPEVNKAREKLRVAMDYLGWPDMLISYDNIPDYLEKGFRKAIEDSPGMAAIRKTMNSNADVVIINAADILSMDSKGRINTPGTVGDWNWTFIIPEKVFDAMISNILRDYNYRYNRA